MSGIIFNSLNRNVWHIAQSGVMLFRTVEEDLFYREPESVSEGGVFFSSKEFPNKDAEKFTEKFNIGVDYGIISGTISNQLQLAGNNAYPSGSYKRCSTRGFCGIVGT